MPPCKRNQAVSTEPVAAFLNLYVRTGTGFHGCDDAFIRIFGQFIISLNMKLGFSLLAELFHVTKQIVFFTGACYDIHFFHGGQFFRADLGITAGYRNDSIRTLFLHAADVLAGLAVCQIGYGTGINNIYVCNIFFPYDFIACRAELLFHGFCFVLVYLAAQSMKC